MPPHDSGWAAVQLLAEPTRRAVFDAVRAARRPLTREEVATAAGINRRLAAFHLDRLAEAALLRVDYARPPGRRGPGAGRPAKRYSADGVGVAVSVPARRYDLAGRILAAAVDQPRTGDPAVDALDLAEEEGRRIGAGRAGTARPGTDPDPDASLERVCPLLRDLGYEPDRRGQLVRLANCPFHAVVEAAPQLVCGLNQRLLAGVLTGLGAHPDLRAELTAEPGDCCVTVTAAPAAGRPG